jgi:predicted DNA-binding protein YlxM (UPF0122 family)
MKIITIENLYDYKLGELMEEIKGDRNVVVSLTTTFSKKFDFFNQKDNIFDSIEERLSLFEELKSLEEKDLIQKLDTTPQVEKYVLFLKQFQKFNNKYLDGQNLLSSEQILNEGFKNYCKEQEGWA